MVEWIIGGAVFIGLVIWFIPWSISIKIQMDDTVVAFSISISIGSWVIQKKLWTGNWIAYLLERVADVHGQKSNPKNADNIQSTKWYGSWLIGGIWRAIQWRQIVWRMKIGMDDAASTAMTVGVVQGLQGLGQKVIRDSDCDRCISCMPDFCNRTIKGTIECIIVLRLGNVIKEIASGFIKRKMEGIR